MINRFLERNIVRTSSVVALDVPFEKSKNQEKEKAEVFRNISLVIMFGIIGFAQSCLQDKVENANSTHEAQAVCRNMYDEWEADYEICLGDPQAYILKAKAESAQAKATVLASTPQPEEKAAGVMQIMPPAPPPPLCGKISDSPGIVDTVIRFYGSWPWDGVDPLSGIDIEVKRDINGDNIREWTTYTEELGKDALPWLVQPDDEVCLKWR